MDSKRFDALSRSLASAGTRRSILRLLGALPLVGALAVVLADEPAEARRHRKAKRHRRGKHEHVHAQKKRKNNKKKKQHHPASPPPASAPPADSGCTSESTAQTCAGRCAQVTKNCGTVIDCGSCDCGACPACQQCDATTGRCRVNPSFLGLDCGFPGQVCQGDGTCACGSGSCPDGQRCNGIVCVCDGTSCPGPCHACDPITRRCLPLADGATCEDGDACTQHSTCQGGVCTGGTTICTTPTVCHTTAGATCESATGQCSYPTQAPNLTVCDPRKICCGGDCVSGTCCASADCPDGQTCESHRCVCTNSSQCPNNHLCVDGSCQACDVTCTGTPDVCATALQAAITNTGDGGTLYVCAGSYGRGPFTVSTNLSLIGAGQGSDGTRLQSGNPAVVKVDAGTAAQPVTLRGLLIQVGDRGILNNGHLTMRDCTVSENGQADSGLGVANFGTLVMTGCTLFHNQSVTFSGEVLGGGLYNENGSATLTDCRIDLNRATQGGGIFNRGGTVSLDASLVTRNDGHSAIGGGIFNESGGMVSLDADSHVCGNFPTDSQCAGFDDPNMACSETCPS